MFEFNNQGKVIYGNDIIAILETADGIRIVFYEDKTFVATVSGQVQARGKYDLADGRLTFTLEDGTEVKPVLAENGDAGYTIGEMQFIITGEFIARV